MHGGDGTVEEMESGRQSSGTCPFHPFAFFLPDNWHPGSRASLPCVAEPEEDNPFASLLAPTAQPPSGPNNEALPNPWASGSSSRPRYALQRRDETRLLSFCP